jgi:uncharacterized protein YkwD
MKYHLLGTLAILITVFGNTTTSVQADTSISAPDLPASQSSPVNPTPSSTSSPVLSKLEQAIYHRVNLYRMSLDLPPLIVDPVICAQAKVHSERMAKTRTMSHDGFRERVESVAQQIPYRSAAENLATNMGQQEPDAVAVQGWIESPGHHRNMIGRFDLTGISVVQNDKGEYYFTQIFVRKRK